MQKRMLSNARLSWRSSLSAVRTRLHRRGSAAARRGDGAQEEKRPHASDMWKSSASGILLAPRGMQVVEMGGADATTGNAAVGSAVMPPIAASSSFPHPGASHSDAGAFFGVVVDCSVACEPTSFSHGSGRASSSFVIHEAGAVPLPRGGDEAPATEGQIVYD